MIVSKQNPKIQRMRSLIGRRKERESQKAFVLEGVRVIEEALDAGAVPEMLLYSEVSDRAMKLIDRARQVHADIDEVSERLLHSISDTKSPQGLMGIFSQKPLPIPKDLSFVLVLDAISDPGNLGTILRSCAAGGVQLVILTPETTDPYSPKVLRAGMGAHFYLPIHTLDWPEIKRVIMNNGEPLHCFLSDVHDGQSCWESDLQQPLALVIGSEATGVSQQAHLLTSTKIHIPMQGKIESLNASIAASILIFEVIRQRRP